MDAYNYILTKQVLWALNQGIVLIGSKGKRGRPAYTQELNQNLFEPLEPQVRECFKKGDGSELIGTPNNPAKMQAVHSSSALAVNIFQYWEKNKQVPTIAAACRICRKGSDVSKRIIFEEKFPIDKNIFRFPPNIDVLIHNSDLAKYKRFAIECKFSEAYASRGDHGLKTPYINLNEIWNDIPNLYNLAKTICPEDNQFHHLHPAQLIKHILGLKTAFGKTGFRLLYLWYDVLGEASAIHRYEIDIFSNVVKSDDIKFHSMSVQELIIRLSKNYRSDHKEYIKYISNRYL